MGRTRFSLSRRAELAIPAAGICALRVAGNLACRRPFRPPVGLKARLWALAFRGACNLACTRPFSPPYSIRDEFLGLQHRRMVVDEAEKSRAEALRRLKPAEACPT